MRLILALVLLLGVGTTSGCALLEGSRSILDAQAVAANEDNVFALVAENNAYTTADTSIPESLKASRAARNTGALNIATRLAESASSGASK